MLSFDSDIVRMINAYFTKPHDQTDKSRVKALSFHEGLHPISFLLLFLLLLIFFLRLFKFVSVLSL